MRDMILPRDLHRLVAHKQLPRTVVKDYRGKALYVNYTNFNTSAYKY